MHIVCCRPSSRKESIRNADARHTTQFDRFIVSFSKTELDPSDPAQVLKGHLTACEIARELFPGHQAAVATQTDGQGGLIHSHIGVNDVHTEVRRLILHVMLAFAEFERDMIVSRCQGGRAYKRATDPDYREGRKPSFSKAQRDHAIDLLRNYSFSDVERMTRISKSTLVREARRRGFRKSKL